MSRPRLNAADAAEMMADTRTLAASEAVPMADAPDEAAPDAPAAEAEPANTNAAEPANDAAPSEAQAETPADAPKPDGKSMTERLAALKKATQKVVAEKRAIAEERAAVQQMRDQVEREVASLRETLQREIASVREKALADVSPVMEAQKLLASDSAEDRLAGLKALGFSYEDTTQMMLGGGGLTPQQLESKLRREYEDRLKKQQDEILRAIEERDAKARAEQEAKAAEAQQVRARQAAIAHAAALVTAEAHPLTVGLIDDGEYSREDIGEAVVKIIEADWEQRAHAAKQQGYTDAQIRAGLRPIDYNDACGMLESSLESDLARLERARQRKLASRTSPDASRPDAEGKASEAVSEPKANQNPGHPTLTSSESATVAHKRGPKSMRELRQQVYQETPVLLSTSGRR